MSVVFPSGGIAALVLMVGVLGAPATRVSAADTLTCDSHECAGMSGFRAHWDRPIAVAEEPQRRQQDPVVKDRGQTAVWGGEKPGPLLLPLLLST